MKITKTIKHLQLKFTPLEFETSQLSTFKFVENWLKFTPLEFETSLCISLFVFIPLLKFTPLEFETRARKSPKNHSALKFTPLEFETSIIAIGIRRILG